MKTQHNPADLTITNKAITSPDTPHYATPMSGRLIGSPSAPVPSGEYWEVTWLPGMMLTRDHAVTAMTIAVMVARRDASTAPPRGGTYRAVLVDLASDLGMAGWRAVELVREEADEVIARAVAELGDAAAAARRINAKAGAR